MSSTLASPKRSNRVRGPLLIGAVAVGAAVTVLALRKGDDRGPATAATAATVSATAAATAHPDDTAKAVETIEVHLSARPEQAKMFLDDTALGTNPFVGRFRRDDKPHTLRVEAEGHASAVRPLSFASDQTVELALERALAPKERPSAAPVGPADPAPPRPGARPKKELDSDDPWR